MGNGFIGLTIEGYTIVKLIGSGYVGSVYKAENETLADERAIKVIPLEVLKEKEHWQQEIIKVNKLRNSSARVVTYHSHGEIEVDGKYYKYIIWDYIPGQSLREVIDSKQITIQIAVDVVEQSLSVFHACKVVGIQHSDFHAGNVLVQNVDPLDIDPEKRKIWVTDFGRGTLSASKALPPMDDFEGLARIIQECIASIDFHQLMSADERRCYRVLKHEFPRYLHEIDTTEGEFVRNPAKLLDEFKRLLETKESIPAAQKNVSDFLAAEFIGDRYDEWNALFVPKFLATSTLLDKNICVLTGLRGCGKTMMFRRLSNDLQTKLGPSGIDGEDSFIGLYLNARVLAEAFPWLPAEKKEDARKQVINFFNVKWCIEILSWLRERAKIEPHASFAWLSGYFRNFFPCAIFTSKDNVGVINSIIDYCSAELLRTKLDSGYYATGIWRFSDYSFLSDFIDEISRHHSFMLEKNMFFFLDDYSTPMVNETMQKILNPVVFRRSANLFFKISTESSESFCTASLNDKVLENGADYKLVDLGSELFRSTQERQRLQDIIVSILEKRIERSSLFGKRHVALVSILGKNEYSNNSLALSIRSSDRRVLYSGIDTFCDLWSSDIRELIKVFSDMLSMEGNNEIANNLLISTPESPVISREHQDKVLREAGGRYLSLLTGVASPSENYHYGKNHTYGEHLRDIVIAFQQIASYDLKNKTSKNQEATPPKQARKIELTSTNGILSPEAYDYYRGLIRYGVFIQDYRAKSVRGAPAQRLFLRGLLIPYSVLTFSRRDCITLDWEDFEQFLLHPKEFAEEYKIQNQPGNVPITGQITMDI